MANKNVIKDGELVVDAVTADHNKKLEEQKIHDTIIEIQAASAKLNNLFDAYGRTYDDDEAKAKMYQWAGSALGTLEAAEKTAKAALTADGKAKSIDIGLYNVEVSFSAGSVSLDTQKLKQMDSFTYSYLEGLFPKKTAPKKTVRIIAKKGLV